MVFKERVEEANRIAAQEIKALDNNNNKHFESDDLQHNKHTHKKQNTFKNNKKKYDI